MDENFNCGLHLPLQVSGDSNSVWHDRENGHPARLSPDLSHNHMGCDVASLDLLHSNHIQNVTGRNENYVSFGKSGTISDEHNDDGTGRRPVTSNCKSDVEIFTREGDDSEVYVRYFSPLRECTKSEDDGSQQHFSKRGENESDESTAMDLKYCPNSRTIKELQASFGQLFRIGTIRGVTWTKEIPNEACRLVLPHPIPVRRTSEDQESVCMVSNYGNNDVSQKGRNHSLLVVDTFASEQDRRRVAAIFGHDLPHNCRHPKKLVYYMKSVAEFGFNHIIIIGETDYGMIFMDCYGRFFQWDDMCQPMLWPNESDDGLPWFVEYDGIVYKFKE